jgi:hypothetical protein
VGNPNKTIIIGKHDDNFNFLNIANRKNKRIRLGSNNPNELKWVNYNVISTNGDTILFESKEYTLLDFFEFAKTTTLKNIMVLTRRERDSLLNLTIDFDVNIKVFEDNFPIFNHVKFVSNMSDNINEAHKLLNECKDLNLNGGSAFKCISTLFRYKQERKLRYKSNLDNIIYFSCFPPFQEVFKAKESRNDRLIFALDFNAMFTDCLSGSYPSPKDLRYSKFHKDDYYHKKLNDGFYRAKLIGAKNSIFLTHHPFRYSNSNKSYNFNLLEGDSIEVFLPKDEIDCYSKYFSTVEIVEGIYSEKQIEHPLFNVATSIYKERKSISSEKPRSQLAKLKANIISSLGNPKRFEEFYCKNKDDIISKFEEIFSIEFDPSLSQEQKLELAKAGNRLHLYESSNQEFFVKIFNNKNKDSVYTLYSKMISNSRIKMIKLIEKLSAIDSLELCYANVDSLHVSINKNDKDSFYALLSTDISENIGSLKIEAVSTSGYWFDLGRYWLLNAGKVTKYSNFLFKQNHNKEPLITERRIKKVASLYGFRYVKSFKLSIFKTFSFKKVMGSIDNIDNISYKRYDLIDVRTASVASTSVCRERVQSCFLKSSLLEELSSVECLLRKQAHIICDKLSC